MVDTVYKIKKGRLEIRVGKDAEEDIKQIEGKGDTSPYKFYHQGGRQVYIVQETSPVEELTFPGPDEYGITSPGLYAKAVTFPWVVAQALRRGLKKPPSFLSQLRDAGFYFGVIVVFALGAFILAVLIKGG